MIGINLKDPPANAQAMISNLGLTYPNLVDESAQTAMAYNVRGIPTVVVIDDAGMLRYQANTLPTMEAVLAMAPGEGRQLAALDGKPATKKRLANRPPPTSPLLLVGAAVGGLALAGGVLLLLLKGLGGKKKKKKPRA